MALTDAIVWQARTTGKACILNDPDGLSQIDHIFAKDVLLSLEDLSIFDVKLSYILAALRWIEPRKVFTTAEKVYTWLNQLFRYAKGVRYDRNIVPCPSDTQSLSAYG